MKLGFLLLSFLLIFHPAWCAMSVYPMEASVTNSGSAQIEVESKSNDVQFVRVTVKKSLTQVPNRKKKFLFAVWKKPHWCFAVILTIHGGGCIPFKKNLSVTARFTALSNVNYWKMAADWEHAFNAGPIDGV